MSDKEKAAEEYLAKWDDSPDELPSIQVEKAFLAGAEWAEKQPRVKPEDAYDAGVNLERELRDEDWLKEMERWFQACMVAPFLDEGYANTGIFAVDLIDHMRDWAKGEK